MSLRLHGIYLGSQWQTGLICNSLIKVGIPTCDALQFVYQSITPAYIVCCNKGSPKLDGKKARTVFSVSLYTTNCNLCSHNKNITFIFLLHLITFIICALPQSRRASETFLISYLFSPNFIYTGNRELWRGRLSSFLI